MTTLALPSRQVTVDYLAFQVEIRFGVPEERAVNAVSYWLDAVENVESRTVDRENLTAWDVLHVFDGLTDFEWTYY